jgi:hypothetical protein
MEEIAQEPVQVVARVCAIDIGKAGLVACVRVPHASRPDRRVQEVREYATVTPTLLALADWSRVERVELVAIEVTSDYWKPVFYLLEAESARQTAVKGCDSDVDSNRDPCSLTRMSALGVQMAGSGET